LQAEQLLKAGVPGQEAQDRYVIPDIGPAITKRYSDWQAEVAADSSRADLSLKREEGAKTTRASFLLAISRIRI
jgi:hypothetical protein